MSFIVTRSQSLIFAAATLLMLSVILVLSAQQ